MSNENTPAWKASVEASVFNWQHFEKILKTIKEGKLDLPNPVPLDLGQACMKATLAWASIEQGRYKILGKYHTEWGLFFLRMTQGGLYTGEGMVLTYNSGKGGAFEFAICKHDLVADHGADPRRGWHPAHCSKCGLDMSVDSGD